jgi:hypothetical protein
MVVCWLCTRASRGQGADAPTAHTVPSGVSEWLANVARAITGMLADLAGRLALRLARIA